MASVAKRKWAKPDGSIGEKWVVRYKDGATHPQKTFTLKKEADAFKRKVEQEIEAGTHVARSRTRTVAETIAEVLADMERREGEGQIGVGYVKQSRMLLGYALPALGHLTMADLTWQDVEAFGKALRRQRSFYYKRPLSPRTVAVAMTCLSNAVAYGVRRGYAARNVVPDAIKELGASPATPIETFTRDEMRTLVQTIEDRPAGYAYRTQSFCRAVAYLGGMCGLRKGEIFALTWEAIDFERSQILVRQSLTPEDVVKAPKTRSGRRVVPMPRMVAEALRAWEPHVTPEPRGLIFRTNRGTSYTDTSFYRDTWHPLLDRAGLVSHRGYGHRHFHALRHFAGSAWLEAGVSLPEVSRLLGHANPAITARVYSHAITEVHHRAAVLDNCAGLLTQSPADAQALRIAA